MKARNKWIAAGLVAASALTAGTVMAQMGGRGAMGGPMFGMLGGDALMREMDTDRDGKLTQAEIDAWVNAKFTRYDTNNDGRLSLEEFAPLWAELTRPAMVRAFQFMDPNGDGGVTKTEVEEKTARLVQRFDRNGDGALSPADRPERGPGRGGPGGPRPN